MSSEIERRSALHPDDLMPHIDYEALLPPELNDPPPVSVVPGAFSFLQLRYADVLGWRPLRLDVHVPATAGPHPVVVYVHGGSFLAGLPMLGPWPALPARGIAVVSVSYRLAGEARFPEPVEDIRAAMRWVAHQGSAYGLDPGRVALWGSSAGGYLAGLAGITGDRPLGRPVGCRAHDRAECLDRESATPAAVIAHYAVSAPLRLRADATAAQPREDLDSLEAIMQMFVGESSVPSDLVDHLSTDQVPPFLLVHGTADRRVGPAQSARLHAALVARGAHSEYVELDGEDHAAPRFSSAEVVSRAVDFLQQCWSAPRTPRG